MDGWMGGGVNETHERRYHLFYQPLYTLWPITLGSHPLAIVKQPGKTALPVPVQKHPQRCGNPVSLTRAPHLTLQTSPRTPTPTLQTPFWRRPRRGRQKANSQQPSWCQSGRPHWPHLPSIGKSLRSGGRENPSMTPHDCLDGQSGAELMRAADRSRHAAYGFTL